MKIYAINGSPRKNGNTATLLMSALDGVKSQCGAEEITTESINLYTYMYKPCISCFQCKLLNGKSYGKCAIKDALTPVIEKISDADGLIFGSPIYFGGITAQINAFLERLLFPYFVYDNNYSSIAPKKMQTAFIYTMNVTEDVMKERKYDDALKNMELCVGKVFSEPYILHAFNTYQFDDYSKYKVECFSEEEKAVHRKTVFPLDMKKAFEMGKKIVQTKTLHA